jgi:hypothetical protein
MSAGRIVADDTPAALLSDQTDAEVSALMAMPRRQAERIQVLLGAKSHDIPRHSPNG